jgi:hypothetical protein
MVNFLDIKLIPIYVLVCDVILRLIPTKHSISIMNAIHFFMTLLHELWNNLIKENRKK